jgi:hypothetical protein
MSVNGDIKTDATFVSVHWSAHRWLRYDHLFYPLTSLEKPIAVTGSAEESAAFLRDRADEVHGRHGTLTVGFHLLDDLQHNCQGRLRVYRTAAIHSTVFDATIEGVIGHVFHTNGVKVDVNSHGPIRGSLKSRVHVATTIEHLVNHDLGSECIGMVGQPTRDRSFAVIA